MNPNHNIIPKQAAGCEIVIRRAAEYAATDGSHQCIERLARFPASA